LAAAAEFMTLANEVEVQLMAWAPLRSKVEEEAWFGSVRYDTAMAARAFDFSALVKNSTAAWQLLIAVLRGARAIALPTLGKSFPAVPTLAMAESASQQEPRARPSGK
jgi:hypothetical protein